MFCDCCLFCSHLLGVNDPAGNGFFCEFQFRFWREVEYVQDSLLPKSCKVPTWTQSSMIAAHLRRRPNVLRLRPNIGHMQPSMIVALHVLVR
jgi:hypothetical protein